MGANDDPPLNADLHISQSDIRPLIREQLGLLQDKIERDGLMFQDPILADNFE